MTHQARNQWKMLSTAIALASEKHHGVLDKGGKPYILHVLRVMNAMPEDDPELRQIAVMHDVVEDTDVTFEQLIQMGFSARVVDALVRLTHMPHDSYTNYIRGINANDDSRQVKLADLKDNSNITRLKGVSEKDINRMIKYQRSYLYLTGKMSEYEYVNGVNHNV